MARAGSLAYNSRPSDAERERIRELSRYYCCTNRSSLYPVANETQSSQDAQTGDEQTSQADLSSDITLTALAQLGVFRLGCNRSFVSLIDGDNQYIVAEATASISLRDKDRHLPDDGIYLGARTLDLVWGVCPHTIRLFTGSDPSYGIDTDNVTANRTRYVIKDFTKEDCFKDRPYVREWPHMRFYAEVPLTSPSGYVLGSYSVVDNKPREHFGDEDIEALQEISDAIGNHLENVRIAHYHRRAERLVKGLMDFSKDQTDFDPRISSENRLQSATLNSDAIPLSMDHINTNHPPEKFSNDGSGNATGHGAHSWSTPRTEAPSPLFFAGQPSNSTKPSSLESNMSRGRPSPGEERSLESLDEAVLAATNTIHKNESLTSLADSIFNSARIPEIFTRASVLLRDAMNLEGVVFLDATRSEPSLPPPNQHAWEPLPKPVAQGQDPPVAACPPTPFGLAEPPQSNVPCEVLGLSLKPALRISAESSVRSQPVVAENVLNTMFQCFPRGQVVNLEDSVDNEDYLSFGDKAGNTQSKQSHISSIAKILAPMFPDAKYVVWLPLWDHQKSRWMAGMLSWSSDSHRGLGEEELHYFKVFGDSIISEISRVNWISTEKSKFDLLSSLSHELRSPLHGILASAELLHGTAIDSTQEEMVKMIETSGFTLLDTTDHLLAYCKINNFSRTKRSKGKHSNGDISSLESEFDLGVLIEEVTNILYTGQRAAEKGSRVVTVQPLQNLSRTSSSSSTDSENLSIVVRVDQTHSWNIRSLPGAWRRIIMNLLGNSLKWTTQGLIEISLTWSRSQANPDQPIAHVSIIDTGRGIATEFLRHKLFTPFAQEDSLVEGVGLGLSIVRQLVNSLDGHINVRSEVDIGTQVDVYIPVQYLGNADPESNPKNPLRSAEPLNACLVGFNGYPDLKEIPTGMLTVEAKRNLSIQSSLADVFMSKAGWKVSLAESLDKGQGDVAVLESSTLEGLVEPESIAKVASENGFKFLIILNNKPNSFDERLHPSFVCVSPPFGPHKLQSSVEKILKLRADSECDTPALTLEQELSETTEKLSITHIEEGPEDPVESPPIIVRPQILPLQTPADRQRHVLVVDDNEINLKIMATFMRKIGCTYETASNGLIALEKYKASNLRFDFVLMDISMPVMDGLVSTNKIRQFEKETGLPPSYIMAVTGVASDTMQQQALAAGINHYLIKPLSLLELKRSIA
ncbi:hypothetical protein N7532_006053 [Penicillium argentinense]|uniref:Uncharacterized protein n=1 Tax=Penicillium argentinense TaxID=1131581 RepID=A0A9W9FFJ0_9EURO|nr:uncharacterized protein N7532_006053 [Penicillium argentinense]KAJ5099052.1 hypothetical protein N7532_006053 [Penicillium argentinense]